MIKKYKQYINILILLLSVLFNLGNSQTLREIQELKKEYEKYEKQNSQIPFDITKKREIDPSTGLPSEAKIVPFKPFEKQTRVDSGLQFFGYNFFTQRDTVAFWENLPTPANYILGPGDELVISLWGETLLRDTYTISRDGKIYDSKVGLLNLAGKTIEEARKYLENQYGRIYATLKRNNPTTYMDISLGQLRSINVNFVGEINYPGVYPVHPFSTVITGLIQAGGVDTTGSLRSIHIKRDGKLAATVDLYPYFLIGDIPKNIQLRDQDIIVVPVRLSTIIVDSSVVRPGIYEAKPDESIFNMIEYAGGMKPTSSNTIGLKRIISKEREDSNNVLIDNHYIEYEDARRTPVRNGDLITVKSIFETVKQVEIIGQVKKPGIYHFKSGLTLKDILYLAGGFEDTTFWKSVYQKRGELVRRNPDSRYETVIEVNLNNVINGNSSENLELQNLDRFVVHANLNFFEKENVQILGEVNIPGSYPLISDNETLKSLLNRAGNLTSKALKNGISIYRDKKYFETINTEKTPVITEETPKSVDWDNVKDMKKNSRDDQVAADTKVRVAWQNESIALMPGDSVIVKEVTGTVNVSGGIYNPGLIEFRKGKSLRYYINSAGGVNQRGDNKSIIVVYANGLVSPKKWYSTPKIEDGATIVVNLKEVQESFDLTTFVTSTLSILSTTVTILVLAQQLNIGS